MVERNNKSPKNTIEIFEVGRSAWKMNGNRVESRRAGWAFGGRHNDDSIASNIFCGITLEHEPNAFVPQATVDGALINQPVGSNHSGGLQIAMVDASTRFISEDVNLAFLKAAAGIADRQDDELE